jgi:hypothetical protein
MMHTRTRSLDCWVWRRFLLGVGSLVGMLAGATSATASSGYGYALIQAGYIRGCAACHDDEATAGGANTANKPFAQTMKRLGLTGGNKADLFVDIVENKLGDHDTDCDGVIDYDELMNNGDPNLASVIPDGFTATPVENCNGDTGSDSTSGTSTTTPSSSPSSTTTNEFADDSGAESGCALAVPASNIRGGWWAPGVALTCMAFRRGRRHGRKSAS